MPYWACFRIYIVDRYRLRSNLIYISQYISIEIENFVVDPDGCGTAAKGDAK